MAEVLQSRHRRSEASDMSDPIHDYLDELLRGLPYDRAASRLVLREARDDDDLMGGPTQGMRLFRQLVLALEALGVL